MYFYFLNFQYSFFFIFLGNSRKTKKKCGPFQKYKLGRCFLHPILLFAPNVECKIPSRTNFCERLKKNSKHLHKSYSEQEKKKEEKRGLGDTFYYTFFSCHQGFFLSRSVAGIRRRIMVKAHIFSSVNGVLFFLSLNLYCSQSLYVLLKLCCQN